ncbi:sensor histidine kinase [Arenibaculum sp.]|uniref:sensor histidine kinase n=1 Tax=Arenibaculum sp. TaxID=2865862 RepID=UPI002E128D24|nr:ATP-binding protein [Arenibaculum sp.]
MSIAVSVAATQSSDPAETRPAGRECTAADLALDVPPVDPDAPCARAFELLLGNDAWPALALVRNGRVAGMIGRAALMTTFAKPLLRDLYDRRPIALLADPVPLVVDARLGLDEVSHRIAHEKPHALATGFVVVDRGLYRGIGTTLDLMARSVEQAKRRARELDEARRAAELASQAKSSFLANMSHELRTPLNAVIGFAEIIESEMLGPLGDRRYRDYASDIHASGRHLLDLISDLLDLSKAEAGHLSLVEARVELRRLLDNGLRFVGQQAATAGVTLRTMLPDGLPDLQADERKLRQMVLNLLSNAVKYTLAGGIVTLSAGLRADGDLAVTVCDTGIGMSPEERRKAMEPFGQVDNALTRRHNGTGLGLPLTKRLVELHGGAIEIDSRPGIGTRAALVFPASRVLG